MARVNAILLTFALTVVAHAQNSAVAQSTHLPSIPPPVIVAPLPSILVVPPPIFSAPALAVSPNVQPFDGQPITETEIVDGDALDRELALRCQIVGTNRMLLSAVERIHIEDLWVARDFAWRLMGSDNPSQSAHRAIAQTCDRSLTIPRPTITSQSGGSSPVKPGQAQDVSEHRESQINTSVESNKFPHPLTRSSKRVTRSVSIANNVARDDNNLSFFPWGPPAATTGVTFHNINNLHRGGFATFGKLDDWLQDTLKSAGYYESKYWSVPGGFVVVTRLEAIDGEARPVGKERFIEREGGPKGETLTVYGWSLVDYLIALTTKPADRARVFLFAVTDHDEAENTSLKMTTEYAKNWFEGGTHGLSGLKGLASSKPLTGKYMFTVLVYEFLKKSSQPPVVLDTNGGLPVMMHLHASGLKIAEHFR
jgi:hypothetical protein